MRKPRNRKERIEFISKKIGIVTAEGMLYFTDKEVKSYVDNIYDRFKNAEDAIQKQYVSKCLRCNEDVLHHYECGCGYDRAIFDEEEWKRDIEDFGEYERLPQDEKFIKNGYQL